MKKLIIVIIVILLFSLGSVWGKAVKPTSEPQDTTSLKLFDTIGHKLQINCTNLGKRIYFIDDIVINKADVEEGKLSFMLNKDFIISDVTINNVSIPIRKFRNVNSKGFFPNIDPEQFKLLNKNISIYEFVLDDLTEAPEQIEIRLKYHLADNATNRVYRKFGNQLTLRGNEFWYPRNLNKDDNVLLTVKTTDQISFSLNAKAVEYTRPSKRLKEYRTSFIDKQKEPALIIFTKKG
ncbi:MAG: hypothetical protein R6V77_05885 [Candidatus Cloacimonadaceae bacterium]